MYRAAVGAVLAVLLVCSALAGVGVAAENQVIGRPSIDLFAPENVVVPGTEATLDVYVSNEGRLQRGGPAAYEDRVTTARGLRLEARSTDAPVRVITGPTPAGSVPDGTSGPFPLRVVVDESAAPGVYRLPVRVSYAYTRVVTYDENAPETAPTYAESTASVERTLLVRVENRPQFRVVDASTDAAVGDTGTVTLAVENVGTRTARDASVQAVSADPLLSLSGTNTSAAGVGEWRPGETKRLRFDANVAAAGSARSYPLTVAVEYTDTDGVRRLSRTLSASVTPRESVRFSVRVTETDLRVGRRGAVSGTLEYTGQRPLTDATLRVVDAPFPATAAAYPLGDLPANASLPFAFRFDVPRNTTAGPRRLEFRVEYDDGTATRRASKPLTAAVAVAPHRDVFRVDASEATVTVDSDARIALRVTNADPDPVSDVTLRLSTTDPLSSDSPEAFVGDLAPGESRTVSVSLTSSDEAIPSTQPVTVRLSYTTADGEDRESDPHVVGVAVVEERQQFPLAALVAVALTVAVAGLWWWRRR